MSKSRFKRLALIAVGTSLAVAGTAAAFLVLNRREVTTSSAEAYRHYKLGRENELKIYEKEAMAEYAEALRYDCNFVMATIRLAEQISKRDPERAKSMVAGARQSQGSITAREEFTVRIFEARYTKKLEPKEMEGLFDEYVRAFPKDADPYRQRAMFYRNQQRSAEAVRDFETLLAISPNDALAYNDLGYYWAGMGDFAKAEDYFRRYRFLAPDQANPYDSLGELYVNTGRYEEGEESLRKSLAVKPDFIHSIAELGTLEVGRGNPAAAAGHFRRAAEMADTAGLRMDYGLCESFCLADAGRTEEAIKRFEQVTAAAEAAQGEEGKFLKKPLPRLRAIFNVRAGRVVEAEAALGAADAAAAEYKGEDRKFYDADMKLLRGLLASKKGRHEEAVDWLSRGLAERRPLLAGFQLYPGLTLCRVVLAGSLQKLGRTKDAEDAIQAVLKVNPRFQPAVTMEAALKGTAPMPVAAR